MKKMYITLLTIFFTAPLQTKLPNNLVLLMAGATQNSQAMYNQMLVGLNDCQKLQFIIQNELTSQGIEPRKTILNYLYVKNYVAQNGNFDNCNLGFDLDSTANLFSAVPALPMSDFSGSSMISVVFSNDYLCGANFSNINATNGNFDGIDAPNIRFNQANLTKANFQHSYIPGALFNNAEGTSPPTILTEAQFIQAVLFDSQFQNAMVDNGNFFFCDFHRVNLSGADCTGTNFNHSFGTVIVSTTTDFTDANFNNTDRLYFDIPTGSSPIFNNTTMPDGTICSGQDCIKHFKDPNPELNAIIFP